MPKNSERIIAYPRSGATTPAQTSVGAAAGIILNANSRRFGMMIQNTGTTTIYLSLGSVNPTVSAYHVALRACVSSDDGNGGIFVDDSWQDHTTDIVW